MHGMSRRITTVLSKDLTINSWFFGVDYLSMQFEYKTIAYRTICGILSGCILGIIRKQAGSGWINEHA